MVDTCMSEWCTTDDPCFECTTTRILNKIEAGVVDEETEEFVRLHSLQLSPAATPSKERKRSKPSDSRVMNSWEKGVARDHRGLPYRDGDGNMIPIKTFSENRHKYEGVIRQLHQQTA